MPKPSELFGKNIKVALGDKSQGWLAENAGTTAAMISDYISGKRFPNLKTAEKIANALGVSLADLFGDEKPTPIPAPIERLRLRVVELALRADIYSLNQALMVLSPPAADNESQSGAG